VAAVYLVTPITPTNRGLKQGLNSRFFLCRSSVTPITPTNRGLKQCCKIFLSPHNFSQFLCDCPGRHARRIHEEIY